MANALTPLFGTGTGLSHVDPESKVFEPLLECIEQTLLDYWREHPEFSDGQAKLSLKQLLMELEQDHRDPVCQVIVKSLAAWLPGKNYSRQDIKMALRRIIKSIDFHVGEAGPGGYFEFIQDYL